MMSIRGIVLARANRYYAFVSKYKIFLAPVVYLVYWLRRIAYEFSTRAGNVICLSLGRETYTDIERKHPLGVSGRIHYIKLLSFYGMISIIS